MFGKVVKIGKTDPKYGTWIDVQTPNGKFSCSAGPKIDISSLTIGSEADFQVESKPKANGEGSYSKLTSFSFAGSAPISAITTPVTKDGISEPMLRFISNVVGTAITSGAINSPTDIKIWALAARDAFKTEA